MEEKLNIIATTQINRDRPGAMEEKLNSILSPWAALHGTLNKRSTDEYECKHMSKGA
jgi:hypothetical protein